MRLTAIVFEVSPKQIEKGKRYLDGRIWVDATDLQIVVTNGRMVPDDTRKRQRGPASAIHDVARAGGRALLVPGLHQGRRRSAFRRRQRLYAAQDVHMRDVIKYTDYKRFGSTSKIIYEGQDISPDNTQKQPGQQPNQQPSPQTKPQQK